MKLALVLALLILFSFGAHALNLDVPPSIPANASFGFSINLDPTEKWTKTTLKVDDAVLLDVYSKGTIVLDPNNGQFVQKAFIIDQDPSSNSGLTLFVSHIGLTKGKHIFSVSSESASDVKNVESFVPLDNSMKADLDSKISSLEADLSVSRKENADLKKKLKEYESRFAALQSDVNSLGSELSGSFDRKFIGLQQRIDGLDAEKKAKEAALQAQEENRKKSPIAGLLNLVDSLLMPLGIIAGIIIVAGIIMVIRSKISENDTVYRRDEYDLPVSKEHEEMAGDVSDGKWAKK